MTARPTIAARFDDLRPGRERSFRLTGRVGVIQARALDEVGPALDRVEEATQRGRWGAGFVAYEASPGLDPAMSVRRQAPGDPFAALPLLWFAIFERREEVPPFEPVADSGPSVDEVAWTASIDRARYDASVAATRERIADRIATYPRQAREVWENQSKGSITSSRRCRAASRRRAGGWKLAPEVR